jgi:hypothetical protein
MLFSRAGAPTQQIVSRIAPQARIDASNLAREANSDAIDRLLDHP